MSYAPSEEPEGGREAAVGRGRPRGRLAAMKQPLHRALAYAWNPTVLITFAMPGHFDSLAIVTFLAALFFLVTNRPVSHRKNLTDYEMLSESSVTIDRKAGDLIAFRSAIHVHRNLRVTCLAAISPSEHRAYD